MKRYVIRRSGKNNTVHAMVASSDDDGVTWQTMPLPPCLNVRHLSEEFEYGYAGNGPSQLALAILCDFFGNTEDAVASYQFFKLDIVARVKRATVSWSLTDQELRQWVNRVKIVPRAAPIVS